MPALHPPVPLELLQFGQPAIMRELGDVTLREAPPSPDGGAIADYHAPFGDPSALAVRLGATPGVIGHGLFEPELVSEILIGHGNDVDQPRPGARLAIVQSAGLRVLRHQGFGASFFGMTAELDLIADSNRAVNSPRSRDSKRFEQRRGDHGSQRLPRSLPSPSTGPRLSRRCGGRNSDSFGDFASAPAVRSISHELTTEPAPDLRDVADVDSY